MRLIGPIACILLNEFKTQAPEGTGQFYPQFMMFLYLNIFYAVGILEGSWSNHMKTGHAINAAAIALITFTAFTVYILTFPSNSDGQGALNMYPLYTTLYQMSMYTTGTWLWIYILSWLGKTFFNQKPSDFCVTLLDSSFYLYLSHYTFLMFAVSILQFVHLPFLW